MLVQRYDLCAKDGQEELLCDRLQALGRWLIRRGGCAKVEILTQTVEVGKLTFLEYWADSETRHAAGISMDRTLIQGIKEVAETMEQETYHRVYTAESRHAQASVQNHD